MNAALRSLMTGAIDYAGMFPPAKLPMDEAVREFLQIHRSPEAWMLGSFVVPASRLDELAAWADELTADAGSDAELQFALLGSGSDGAQECVVQLEEDLQHVSRFVDGALHSPCGLSLELPLPTDLATAAISAEGVFDFFEAIQHPLKETGTLFDAVFVEVPAMDDADAVRRSLIAALASVPDRGFKLRTGGLTADAFPTVDQLAAVVHACSVHGCRWKATAGLHHPLRRPDAQLGATMHGFLNVLFAAVLADVHRLEEPAIAEILADEDPASFRLGDEGIRWRDFAATVPQIDATRSRTFQSFGSCSFDEPRDDLRKLGWL